MWLIELALKVPWWAWWVICAVVCWCIVSYVESKSLDEEDAAEIMGIKTSLHERWKAEVLKDLCPTCRQRFGPCEEPTNDGKHECC
jgi:hypothetical protein